MHSIPSAKRRNVFWSKSHDALPCESRFASCKEKSPRQLSCLDAKQEMSKLYEAETGEKVEVKSR